MIKTYLLWQKFIIDIVCYKLVYSFVLNYCFVLSFIYQNEVY